jgi:hypothetical protein
MLSSDIGTAARIGRDGVAVRVLAVFGSRNANAAQKSNAIRALGAQRPR